MKVIDISAQDTIPIRHRVLWPNEPPEYCEVDGDDNALHFGVIQGEELVCVASIFIEKDAARLRKFATLQEYQGQGIGTFMLNFLVKEVKNLGIPLFWLDARESAIEFYQRFGFLPEGKQFFKNNVPYVKMFQRV